MEAKFYTVLVKSSVFYVAMLNFLNNFWQFLDMFNKFDGICLVNEAFLGEINVFLGKCILPETLGHVKNCLFSRSASKQ